MLKDINTDLILMLNKGNEVAFEKIYKYFTPPLFSFASGYLPYEGAEEVVQETMLWLWTNRATIISEMSLKSLLFTIVKNKCLNTITREKTKSKILEDIKAEISDQFDTEDFIYEQELLGLFKSALDNMPELYRESFKMSRIDNLTHKEIADKLGMSKQTINYRLSKALDYLRTELKEYLPVILLLL